MENDEEREASTQDAETLNLESNDRQGTPENEDSHVPSDDESSSQGSEIIEDLKRRNAGQSKKINELQEKLSGIEKRLQPEDQEEELPEEFQKYDKEQLDVIEKLVEKKLEKKLPEVLSSNETLSRAAAHAAKEDEYALKEFKERHPDAYTGDDLFKDMDDKLVQKFNSFSKAMPSESLDKVLESAYIATYPEKYATYLQKGGAVSAESYRMRQASGGGYPRHGREDRTEFTEADKRLFQGFGFDINDVKKFGKR